MPTTTEPALFFLPDPLEVIAKYVYVSFWQGSWTFWGEQNTIWAKSSICMKLLESMALSTWAEESKGQKREKGE